MSKIDETLPEDVQKMIGTEVDMMGYIFNRKDEIERTTFNCLNARWGTSISINRKTLEERHPTFELLLKNENMIKAKWTLPMPYRKIKL